MWRHPIERAGKPVANRAAELGDLVVRLSVPLAITNTRSASRRRACSATTSAAGLPKTTVSISPKSTWPESSIVFPPLA
jgi:hypothetical protein